MKNFIYNTYNNIADYCYNSKAFYVVDTIGKTLQIPMVFEKTLQIFIDIVALKNIYYQTKSLPSLTKRWEVIGLQNFFSLARRLQEWLMPVSALTIDSKQCLDQLKQVICDSFQTTTSYQMSAEDAELIAYTYLKAELTFMQERNIHYSDPQEFVTALKNRMLKDHSITVDGQTLHCHDTFEANSYDLSQIDFSNITVPLIRESWPSYLFRLNSLAVDILSVAATLKIWNMVNTAKIANKINVCVNHSLGRPSPIFNFLIQKPIELWMQGALCALHSLTILKVLTTAFSNEKITYASQKRLILEELSALTNLVFHAAMVVKEIGFRDYAGAPLHVFSILTKVIVIGCAVTMPSLEIDLNRGPKCLVG